MAAIHLAKNDILPDEMQTPPIMISIFGALWGLACGVRTQTLARAIVGLHLGAVIGFLCGIIHRDFLKDHEVIPVTILCSTSLGLLTGLITIDWDRRVASFFRGFLAGLIALVLMVLVYMLLHDSIDRLLPSLGFRWRIGENVATVLGSGVGMAYLLRGLKTRPPENPR